MKNYLSLITILCLLVSNAQETDDSEKYLENKSSENYAAKDVTKMAIFPGCEKFENKGLEASQKCLASEINKLLSDKFDNFGTKLEQQGLTSAIAKLQFVIDKYGKISQIKPLIGGNEEFGRLAEIELTKIANETKNIKPALLENGSPVNLVFQIPLKYVLYDSKIKDFEWSEIVIATLKDENSIYEIRQEKNKNFKVYEIKNNTNLFLGNFKSYNEIISAEPYKSIAYANAERLLMAEGKINNVLYRLYYSKKSPEYIDAYKIVNNVEEHLESLPQSRIEYSSLYLKLVLRK